jgi:hypothetical protein
MIGFQPTRCWKAWQLRSDCETLPPSWDRTERHSLASKGRGHQIGYAYKLRLLYRAVQPSHSPRQRILQKPSERELLVFPRT